MNSHVIAVPPDFGSQSGPLPMSYRLPNLDVYKPAVHSFIALRSFADAHDLTRSLATHRFFKRWSRLSNGASPEFSPTSISECLGAGDSSRVESALGSPADTLVDVAHGDSRVIDTVLARPEILSQGWYFPSST